MLLLCVVSLSLQQKVQQCLDDGVRLPVQDLKRLEVENTQLLEQREHSNRVEIKTHTHQHTHIKIKGCVHVMLSLLHLQLIEHQREQIERLTLQLTVLIQLTIL